MLRLHTPAPPAVPAQGRVTRTAQNLSRLLHAHLRATHSKPTSSRAGHPVCLGLSARVEQPRHTPGNWIISAQPYSATRATKGQSCPEDSTPPAACGAGGQHHKSPLLLWKKENALTQPQILQDASVGPQQRARSNIAPLSHSGTSQLHPQQHNPKPRGPSRQDPGAPISC